VPSLSHEFEPWQWTTYAPTWVDWSILLGSFGWFSMWFLLFIKQFPVIAISEVKEIVPPRLRTHSATTEINVSGQHVDYSPETPGEHE
jgi:molybdopterin-containing oxidoreductase family membrane subunit